MLELGLSGFLAFRIVQHRELADRPEFQQRRALFGIAEIDGIWRKGRAVFIQRDQDFPAEGGQGMVVQGQ